MAGVLSLMVGSSGGPRVNLQGLDSTDNETDPADASASYSLTSAGLEDVVPGGSGTWLLSGSASDYEVRATVVSGSVTSGTLNTWLGLGTTRTWTRTRTTVGSSAVTLQIEIRLAATGTVIATAQTTLTAQVIA